MFYKKKISFETQAIQQALCYDIPGEIVSAAENNMLGIFLGRTYLLLAYKMLHILKMQVVETSYHYRGNI